MTLQQLKYIVTLADCSSMNEASKQLFISQPSLSEAIKELETEVGVNIFNRTNRGITLTPEGEEFLGYARQVLQQYKLMEDKYISNKVTKKKFSISAQHYTFAIKAFVEMVKQFGMDEYEFAINETKTHEVIEDVKNLRSELGILYLNDFNEKVITKLLKEYKLEFKELFKCGIYIYMWKGNPLSQKSLIKMEDLEKYPCLAFDQGTNNSFYFSEEVLSTYDYKRVIKVNDRGTVINLMKGLNGYILCSGIMCEDLNGSEYVAIPLESDEIMRIGYISRKGMPLSNMAVRYLEEIQNYKKNLL